MRKNAVLLLKSGQERLFFSDYMNQIVKAQDMRIDNLIETCKLKNERGAQLVKRKKMLGVIERSFKSLKTEDHFTPTGERIKFIKRKRH